jgi:hypothetical protein
MNFFLSGYFRLLTSLQASSSCTSTAIRSMLHEPVIKTLYFVSLHRQRSLSLSIYIYTCMDDMQQHQFVIVKVFSASLFLSERYGL